MRIAIPVLLVALAGLATTAVAADRPVAGPVPDWVQPVADVAPGPATDAALQVLLSDQQVRFSPAATEYYTNTRVRIQTPQGLQSIGTVALGWQPDADIITVHRLEVRRGTQVRNLLEEGDGFTILRREDLLEQATLTGALTAILQPPDLQVGDIVEFAYTRRHADPVVPDKPDLQFAWFNSPVQVAHFRAQWPEKMAMRWQLRDFKPEMSESTTGGNHVIDFTLQNPAPLLQPTGAPARYAAVRRIQLTAFQSWQEVSKRFAPLYAEAAKLAKDSPLQAEIERIRKAATDPKERAGAALRLVQEQVRYVLLAMNQGALVPASADQTWQRRYGDCKAKTALLLALLQGLGIEAEAVTVNTTAGDGINMLLPAISAFDHVLVRAQIAGNTYWLDGTRTADRRLEQLQVPDFRWGLPLSTRGSELVRIQPVPLTEPQLLREVNLDASTGAEEPARFQGRTVFRGDTALGLKLSLDNADATQRDQGLRNFWRSNFDGLQVDKVESRFDEATGTLTLLAEGMHKLEWYEDFHEIEEMNLGYKPDFSRPAGSNTEAPYAVAFPAYTVDRVTVKLPASARAFTVSGEDIDAQLAGWEYKRKARIVDAVFTAESSSRSLVTEITAQDARASEAGLREMYKNRLFIVKPRPLPSAAELQSQAGKPLDSAGDYIDRGFDMMERGMYEPALAEFTSALRLEPANSLAFANRGLSHLQLGHRDEARSDLRQASRLDPKHPTVLRGLGALALEEGRAAEAIDLLSRSLQDEDNGWARERRARAYLAIQDVKHATEDLVALARGTDAYLQTLFQRLAVELLTGERFDDAHALAQVALEAKAGPAEGAIFAAGIYSVTRAVDKGRQVLDAAIAKAPSPELLTARASMGPTPETTTADLEQALALDPTYMPALRMLVSLHQVMKTYPPALQAIERLEAAAEPTVETSAMRGEMLLRMGNTAEAGKAYAVARKLARTPSQLNSVCWSQAIASEVLLQDALKDCDAALAAQPTSPAFLDSRGLVLLKLKRYDEAIASYDAAIAASPRLVYSLYGRGIAKLRLGRTAEGEKDIAAARDIDPRIELGFEDYGVRR